MSGIAGILHLDGRPVAVDDVSAMTATMACRGPDGIHHWAAGPVGLGHCMFRTTHQSLVEVQPARADAADLCLTMDGRVDNREDLVAALGPARASLRNASDAELVLQCYQRWGTASVARIVGDFAFALWDGARQQLVCARDFLGKRPFYYSSTGATFRFASEPQAVLLDPTVPRVPNEGMIGELLSVRVTNSHETLFRHLYRLPPAHLMVVTRHGTRVTRYWDWDPVREVRHPSDEEYADHLLELCAQAAEARLSSPWRRALSLSGGVDSSSLVGVLGHLRQAGRDDGDVDVYSLVYPGRRCDERVYIHAVARLHNLDVHESQPGPVGAAPYEAQARRFLDIPAYPMTLAYQESLADARRRGCRVLLTGKGPDEWLTGSDLLADRVRRGQLRGLGARLRADAGTSAPLGLARYFWHHGLKPFVPPGALAAARSAIGRTAVPDFIRPPLAKAVDLDRRLRRPMARGPNFATADVAAYLSDGWHAHANEFAERAFAAAGLECRDPFDDRRVVEFALAIPEEQRRRGGTTKYVLRQAMIGLVPDIVRTRRDKGNYSHLICDELATQGGAALFADLELDRRGWVDGSRVSAMYDQLDRNYREGNPAYHRHLWSLWLIVGVERWLRATFPRPTG